MDTSAYILMNLLNVTFYITFLEQALSPSIITFSVGFNQRLGNTIGFNFSRALKFVANFLVSMKRVNELLLLKEVDSSRVTQVQDTDLALSIENLSYNWTKVFFFK